MRTGENHRPQCGQPPETTRCEGCGEEVKELPPQDVGRLRWIFADEVIEPVSAFECARCEAIIYSDEFTLGKFVPPQFRTPGGSILVTAASGPGYMPPRQTDSVTLSAREGGAR